MNSDMFRLGIQDDNIEYANINESDECSDKRCADKTIPVPGGLSERPSAKPVGGEFGPSSSKVELTTAQWNQALSALKKSFKEGAEIAEMLEQCNIVDKNNINNGRKTVNINENTNGGNNTMNAFDYFMEDAAKRYARKSEKYHKVMGSFEQGDDVDKYKKKLNNASKQQDAAYNAMVKDAWKNFCKSLTVDDMKRIMKAQNFKFESVTYVDDDDYDDYDD